ncbi:MAG: hypothetical protein HC929_24725 [Leptolyngbyaceae cyanobacterium SM2_5_2]|nr:hypothetical protein [Leptolyngbyaceae cyanobacterium SM2_5_2]
MNDASSDTTLGVTLQSLVTTLLVSHAYGVCELAQECAQQLHEPCAKL